MATIKIILDTRRKKKDGSCSLKLRVFNGNHYRDISLGISLHPEHWDETTRSVRKSHPNYKLLNHRVLKSYTDLEAKLLLQGSDQPVDLDTLKDKKKVKPIDQPDFFEYGYGWVERLSKAGKVGNARAYVNTLKRLSSYLGQSKLAFREITYDFLLDFQTNLRNKGVKQNTVSFYLRTMRTILNKAIKAKVMDRKDYPFNDFSIQHESTVKRAVSREVIRKIEDLDLHIGTPAWHYRNYFLLSFYLIGISFVDLAFLKWSDIRDGRVIFRRKKTGKIYSVHLTLKARGILDWYKEQYKDTPYILPVIPVPALGNPEKEMYYTRQGYKYCNKYLKKMADQCGIEEKITTYVARHSWATIAKSLGYSKDLIAEALGHEYGNKVTGIYLDQYGNEVIDEANERVTS